MVENAPNIFFFCFEKLDRFEIKDLTIGQKACMYYFFWRYASIEDIHGCLSRLWSLQDYMLELLAMKRGEAVSVSSHHFSVPPTTFATVHQAQHGCLT